VTWILERTPLTITDGRLAEVHDWSAVARYKEYIKWRSETEGSWGLKQYRLSMFLADFVDWCPNEVVLIVTRRPINESVISVLQRRGKEGITFPVALAHLSEDAFWLEDALSRFTGRVLEIDFLSLIQNPETVVRGLMQFIGRPCSPLLVGEVFPAHKRVGARKRLANRYRLDTTPVPVP
jgi:hypothetical protein